MEIIMPKMGESVNEGTILKWHKKVGDPVKQDEIIFEISTDKVDTEIPSPIEGILKEIKVNEGDTVDVGTVVAIVDDAVSSTNTEQPEPIKEEEPPKVELKIELESGVNNKKVNGDLLEIEMPKMGESVMEGTIIKWYKKVGDNVKKDETIFEISTDKVDTEIPSPVEGTLAQILIGEQETVAVGTIVAKISTTGETVTRSEKDTNNVTVSETQKPVLMHENFSKNEQVERDKIKGDGSAFYSPLVLNIAQKENVSFDELKNISGSGLQGRVTKKDILSYIENRVKHPTTSKTVEIKKEPTAVPAPSFAPSEVKPVYSSTGVEKIPMDNIRQKIMDHMVASRDTSVHVTSMIEVDMARVHNFIQEKKIEFQQKYGVKLTYMAFIAQACVKAIESHPLINSTIDGNNILQKSFINLGIAVAIQPTGLIVPNIKSAEQLNLIGIAKAINDLAQRSRNKRLTPEDISGGTFTITNYGVFGTVFGTPIINQPEVAILGVGAVIKRPIVINVEGSDSIAIRPVLALTLAHDHRLIDGMLGGLFLKHLKETLENFESDNL
jgi:2-oxoglutarate dehydrogenase dihydrolipoamide succinyltransferase (E2 component)